VVNRASALGVAPVRSQPAHHRGQLVELRPEHRIVRHSYGKARTSSNDRRPPRPTLIYIRNGRRVVLRGVVNRPAKPGVVAQARCRTSRRPRAVNLPTRLTITPRDRHLIDSRANRSALRRRTLSQQPTQPSQGSLIQVSSRGSPGSDAEGHRGAKCFTAPCLHPLQSPSVSDKEKHDKR
jgi:hypothetical protein